jgi:hypothetical protein
MTRAMATYRGWVSYVLLADAHTFRCRTWDDLAAKLMWAREEGYQTAAARLALRKPGASACA